MRYSPSRFQRSRDFVGIAIPTVLEPLSLLLSSAFVVVSSDLAVVVVLVSLLLELVSVVLELSPHEASEPNITIVESTAIIFFILFFLLKC